MDIPGCIRILIVRIKKGIEPACLSWEKKRAATGSSSSARKSTSDVSCLFPSEMGYHNPMFENSVFIARSPLVYPDMVCSVSEYEILIERGFVLQAFHTCTKFGFIDWKKNRVHDSEIDFFRFIAIAAKDVFDCYIHSSIGLIEVFRVH